jgi:hypothetical protein
VDTAYSNNVQYPRSQLSGPYTYGTIGKEEWCTQAQVDAERGLKHDHWATASTRSPRAVFEVLFRFPAERRDAAERSVSRNEHSQAGAATIDVEGTLSTGHTFRCRYKCAEDKDSSTATKDPFLGRTVSNVLPKCQRTLTQIFTSTSHYIFYGGFRRRRAGPCVPMALK